MQHCNRFKQNLFWPKAGKARISKSCLSCFSSLEELRVSCHIAIDVKFFRLLH